MTNPNFKNHNPKPIATQFVIISLQFVQMLKLAGKMITPFNDPKFPAMEVRHKGGDQFSVAVGKSCAHSRLPLLDDGFGDKLLYRLYQDGTASITTITKPENEYNPLVRELTKTVLRKGIFVENDRPVPVRLESDFTAYSNGGPIRFSKGYVHGAEIVIVYQMIGEKPNIEAVVGRGGEYSDEAVKWFKGMMKELHCAPTTAFDHMFVTEPAAAVVEEVRPEPVVTAKPAKAAKATKPKAATVAKAKKTKKATAAATETVAITAVTPAIETPRKVISKKELLEAQNSNGKKVKKPVEKTGVFAKGNDKPKWTNHAPLGNYALASLAELLKKPADTATAATAN